MDDHAPAGWSGRPIPQPTSLSRPYWDACKRGELTYPRCADCGLVFFPPESACIGCQSARLEWQQSSGRGTVYSFTVLHRPPSEGFPVPSVLAIVDLDEGYSMFSGVVDCAPSAVRIGMDVEVTFEPLTDDISLPMFRPSS